MNVKSLFTLTKLWFIALVLVNAWLMTQSVLLMDLAREFSYALLIAQGQKWPLMGPEFGGFIHHGQVWFYLMALPLLKFIWAWFLSVVDFLCFDQIQIHNPGAAVLDLLPALPARITCPQQILLMGGKPQSDLQQWLFMHRSFWDKIPITPKTWVTPAWGVSKNITTYNGHKSIQSVYFDGYVYLPRNLRDKQATQTPNKSIQNLDNSILVIIHLLPFYTINTVIEVTANGFKVEKLMANIGNSLYYCAACEPGPVDLEIAI